MRSRTIRVAALAIIVVCSLVLSFHALSSQPLKRSPKSKLHKRAPQCPGFEGNSDFYGLGIRIGIYLQWYSAWLSNTLNPMGAATNHDANAIFVLAVLIAIIVALANNAINAVELYIMLVLSNGFTLTVLSLLGVRLYFLQPGSASLFLQNLCDRFMAFVVFVLTGNPAEVMRWRVFPGGLRDVKQNIFWASLGAASDVKHPALSWAGVFFRAAIVSLLSGLNIYVWFAFPKGGLDCNYKVFFFGEQELAGGLTTFLKIAAVTTSIFAFLLLLISYQMIRQLYFFLQIVLQQDLYTRMINAMLPENLSEKQKRLLQWLADLPNIFTLPHLQESFDLSRFSPLLAGVMIPPSPTIIVSPLLHGISIALSNAVHIARPAEFAPPELRVTARLADFMMVLIALLSRGIEADALGTRLKSSNYSIQTMPYVLVATLLTCLTCHLLTFVVITLLIVFLERTIAVAGITGVGTIRTTGQLIPFIIGISSTLAAGRDLMVLLLRKRFPRWQQAEISLGLEPFETATISTRGLV